jgi:hypothetical protein
MWYFPPSFCAIACVPSNCSNRCPQLPRRSITSTKPGGTLRFDSSDIRASTFSCVFLYFCNTALH